MSRQLEGVSKGMRFFEPNTGAVIGEFHFGTAAPDGLGDLASAPIGSIYFRSGTKGLYEKETNVGDASDWVLNGSGSSSVLPIFRNIITRSVTGEVLSAGTTNPTTWSDNESGLASTDHAVGEYVIGGVGGTPILFEVTNVSAPNITLAVASPALAENDGFIVRAYLPDSPANQENQAMVAYQDGNIVKLADIDWNFATGISLSGSFAKVNGTVTGADSVETAIEKLADNQEDLTTLTGVAQGSVDLGAFTGALLGDTETIKSALQVLETAIEGNDDDIANLVLLSGRPVDSVNHGVMDQGSILSDNATTNALFKEIDAELTKQQGKFQELAVGVSPVNMASVLVDEVANAWYLVTAELASTPANKRHYIVFMGHNGSASADASTVDESVRSILKQGSNFNASVSATLSGAGGTQAMNLTVSSTEAGGVNFYAKKLETLF